ncbi:acyl-CoA thioesterase [Glaciecola sp. SC05]|uniref:acyl-CoA thioesterase n=1 Tax=Glaciecola sp. SC05 TaxID=1987355 RepID=UPI00352866B6
MTESNLLEQNELTLYLRVRYGECDAQNVVFNARYADYADIAATEYFRALVGDCNALLKAGFENQVVSYHIDWFSSALFDDVLALKVTTTHVGNTSFQFTIDCAKRAGDSWQKIAQMKTTYVMLTASDFVKCPIPHMFKEAFARKFERVVNQAG